MNIFFSGRLPGWIGVHRTPARTFHPCTFGTGAIVRAQDIVFGTHVLLVELIRQLREVQETGVLLDAVHVFAIVTVYGIVHQGSAGIV